MTHHQSAKAIATLAVVCLTSTAVRGEVVVNAGDHQVAVGTTTVDLPVVITNTSSDVVTDMVGYAQLDDGGALLGHPRGPMVTSISYGGSIWETANSGFTSFFGSVAPRSQVVDPQVSLNAAGETVLADGTLFTLTVDLTGFTTAAGQSFPVLLSNSNIGAGTAFQNMGSSVATTLLDGSITVVPEPSSVVMLLAGVLFLTWTRRNRA